MMTDRTELDDLNAFNDRSDEHREVVDRLVGLWEDYAEDVGVYPLDGRTHFERLETSPNTWNTESAPIPETTGMGNDGR